jgi:hypothetical protein
MKQEMAVLWTLKASSVKSFHKIGQAFSKGFVCHAKEVGSDPVGSGKSLKTIETVHNQMKDDKKGK